MTETLPIEPPSATSAKPRRLSPNLIPFVKGDPKTRAIAIRGRKAQLERKAREERLAALALALGSADLALQYRGALNATAEVILSRLTAEANRSPLRPKYCRELLQLAGDLGKLLGISIDKPRSGGDPPANSTRSGPLTPTPAAPSTSSITQVDTPQLRGSPTTSTPVDLEPLESAPID